MASLEQRKQRRLARRPNDSGSELIELAIVLPILLLVFAAIVDFGFLFQRYEVVTNSAREGARLATLPGYSTTAGGDVESRVKAYLTSGGLDPNLATVTATSGSQTVPGGLVVPTVTVSVTYPYSFVFLSPIAPMVGGGPTGDVTLRAASTMRTETAGSGGGS